MELISKEAVVQILKKYDTTIYDAAMWCRKEIEELKTYTPLEQEFKDTNSQNDVIVVQIDCLMPMQNIMAFRKDLLSQMEEGIIVIPPWAHVSHVGDECKIEVKEMEEKINDKLDG